MRNVGAGTGAGPPGLVQTARGWLARRGPAQPVGLADCHHGVVARAWAAGSARVRDLWTHSAPHPLPRQRDPLHQRTRTSNFPVNSQLADLRAESRRVWTVDSRLRKRPRRTDTSTSAAKL